MSHADVVTRFRCRAIFGAVFALGVLGWFAPSVATAGSTDQAAPVFFDVGGGKILRATLPKGLFQRCRYRFSGGNTPSVPTGWSGTEWWYMQDSQRGLGLRTVYSLYFRAKGSDSLEAASRAWGENLPATCTERGWSCPKPPAKWEKLRQKIGAGTVPTWKATFSPSHPGFTPKSPIRGTCWVFEAGESIVVVTSLALDEGDLSGVLLAGLALEDRPPTPPPSVHAQFMDNITPFSYVTMDVVRPWVADHGADLDTCVAGWTVREGDTVVARMYLRGDYLDAAPVLKDYVEARRGSYTSTYEQVSEATETKASDGLRGLLVSFVEPAADPKPKAWTTHVYFPLGPTVWSLAMTTTEADPARRAEVEKSLRECLKTFHLWGAAPK